MPDILGMVNAGADNVATPGPTPVMPDAGPDAGGTSNTPAPSGGAPIQPQTPTPPTQHPTFFRRLLFSLGQGLIEGTKAGLQAPLSAQGPSIASNIAINAPQQRREQMTTNQMNDLNVAMTQLKLHQTQMITQQMQEDQQNAVYNSGRDVTTALMEKGKVVVMATGDMKSIQDEFARRQADAKASGQGLLPLQILPAAGSSAKDPKYALINVGKDRLTEDMNTTFGADDLGVSEEDFKAAGLTPFKFTAPAGMDQQKALQLMVTQHLNWLTKSQNQLGQMKRTQIQEAGRTTRARDANDVRRAAIAANNIYRDAKQQLDRLRLDRTADKTEVAALGKVVQASKNVSDKQTITAAAWEAMSAKERANVETNEKALKEAQDEYARVRGKATAGNITVTKVPPGTKITPAIASQYLQKAGGDKAKAMQLAKADGYQ